MHLNHLNLVVTDVAGAVHLFTRHFGFSCLENRRDALAVLTNTDKFVLVLWSAKLNKTATVQYPENFHIGFYQPDQAAVLTIYQQLQGEPGVTCEGEPKKLRNTFGFYFYVDNVLIEVSVLPA